MDYLVQRVYLPCKNARHGMMCYTIEVRCQKTSRRLTISSESKFQLCSRNAHVKHLDLALGQLPQREIL